MKMESVSDSKQAVQGFVDLETIPGQIGTAILRSSDGAAFRPCTGQMTKNDSEIIYQMMLEAGTILSSKNRNNDGSFSLKENEGLRRLIIGFQSVRYAASIAGDGLVYIVKSRSS
eukprot:CAMPEP_0194357356 /NCGR_PEP_ID=MMETSP0174-20130528/4848_1 /TAXON_ID=216777 /ORGANISM="Proboscia alata, Strain PI-D3" /LENGTH=114 /DNA_ID=CAMNT_0039127337 /DNA_START=1 /DNA_END=345 /DNA_ORIENTATION=+